MIRLEKILLISSLLATQVMAVEVEPDEILDSIEIHQIVMEYIPFDESIYDDVDSKQKIMSDEESKKVHSIILSLIDD